MFNYSYETKDLEDETKKKTDKILKIILKEVEKVKKQNKKEITVEIGLSIMNKINQFYLIKALTQNNLKVKVFLPFFNITWS